MSDEIDMSIEGEVGGSWSSSDPWVSDFVIAEWKHEPDRKHWVDEASGLDCLILRNPVGVLCGYVGVPAGHPWYSVDYSDIAADVDVHGGLTFSSRCDGSICHDTAKGDKIANHDVWWLGFDTAHYNDFIPNFPIITGPRRQETYKNIAFVEAECSKLAAQVRSNG